MLPSKRPQKIVGKFVGNGDGADEIEAADNQSVESEDSMVSQVLSDTNDAQDAVDVNHRMVDADGTKPGEQPQFFTAQGPGRVKGSGRVTGQNEQRGRATVSGRPTLRGPMIPPHTLNWGPGRGVNKARNQSLAGRGNARGDAPSDSGGRLGLGLGLEQPGKKRRNDSPHDQERESEASNLFDISDETVERFRQIGIQAQQAGYPDLTTGGNQLGVGYDASNYFGQFSDGIFFSKTSGNTPDATACVIAAINETFKRSGSERVRVICRPIIRKSDPDAALSISHGDVSRSIHQTFSPLSFRGNSKWSLKHGSSSRGSSTRAWMQRVRRRTENAAAARNTASPQELPSTVHPSHTFLSNKVILKQTGTSQSIKDIRIGHEDELSQNYALAVHWPCAPEGVVDSRSSGLICATVVARAMWSRLKPQCWPEPKPDEDAITTYTFADFREGQPGLEEALQKMWAKAKESVSRQQRGETADDSFASICRSPGFVRAFWTNPRFQLTTPHLKAGWAYDERHVVLEGEDLAKQAVVAWDGVEPATVEEAVNSLTFKEFDDRQIMTFAFFRSPLLLQIDFSPGEGSKKSLADIQKFSANKWEFVPDPNGMVGGVWKVTGQVPYTIMAIVLHRETKDGVDSVRLFRESGMEELPVGAPQIQWPFDLEDPIPTGSKVTVFYESVLADSEVLNSLLGPSERLPKAPLKVQKELKGQVGPGSVWVRGAMVEDTDHEQVEEDFSVFTDLATSSWEQARARYETPGSNELPQSAQSQPDAPDNGVTLPKISTARSSKDGTQAESSHGRTSSPSPMSSRFERSSMPPPHAPTEPRADREAKRSREDDEKTRRRDFKRPRRSDQTQTPTRNMRATFLTGANSEGISGNRLRPGEGARPGRDSQVDAGEDLNQQGPMYSSRSAERGRRPSSSWGGKWHMQTR